MRKKLNRRRPVIEALESRRLLATFVVNDTGTAPDPFTGDGLCDTTNDPSADPPVGPSGICTLPAAVESANGSGGADIIEFDIPGAGVPTINLGAFGGVAARDPVTIDGTTQPGAGMVEVQGVISSVALSLSFGSNGSHVTGLVINNSQIGMLILSDDNTIVGNRFGTDPAGTDLMPITGTAIWMDGNDNTIGGPLPEDRNIISGSLFGVLITEALAPANVPTGNVVQGNYIGTDITGTVPFGNATCGVDISFAAQNTIADNVISGNGTGVCIRGNTATGNVVVRNMIGTDPLGTVTDPDGIPGNGDELGNGKGVLIDDAPMNFIGGIPPGGSGIVEGNVISGSTGIGANFGPGVHISNANATGNVVQGNMIGTDAAGIVALPNDSDAVHIADAGGNTIGGTNLVNRNIISGNGGDGVFMFGNTPGNTTNNVVIGNYIGTDAAGMVALPNVVNGVTLGLNAANNTIGGNMPGERNLISGNDGSGVLIALDSAQNNVVKGNFIGTDVTGGVPLGNGGDGVEIDDAPNNTIGGAEAGASNVISSNAGDGVFITGMAATGNMVLGNFIGTDVNGTAPMGNAFDGVAIQGAPGNTIGGPNPGDGNLISANDEDGVFITDVGAVGNTVQGNKIGTDVNGTAPLGNGLDGVGIDGAPGNTIGGPNPGEGNLISANDEDGVFITDVGAVGNTVQGNKIGTDVTGAAALGNGIDGVGINGAPGNTIGGPGPDDGNLISANVEDGVFITGAGANGNTVQGNLIGTDVNGDAPLGNGGDGVEINDAPGNTIGGAAAGAKNVIADNGQEGVFITGVGAAGNFVLGNHIGTDVTGTAPLGNGIDGVGINGAPNNTIGGPGAGDGNLISANVEDGVFITGAGANGNTVEGNFIGTDMNGNAPLGNGGDGVEINNAPGNTIGGAAAGARNVIADNGQEGVFITGVGAAGNFVLGNHIGTDVTGTAPLGNGIDGVGINGAPGNTIGGPGAGDGNLISANVEDGVFITGAGANGNTVQGNLIGTDVNGDAPLGNGGDGVEINDAPGNTIGGAAAGAKNVIADNGQEGVFITGVGAAGNFVLGNHIGTDVTGTAPLGNGIDGVGIDGAPGNTIGGPGPGEGNLISANGFDGVFITGAGAKGNTVEGNLIGTDVNGDAPLGNGGDGVEINNAPGNTIGGAAAGARNVIADNGQEGVFITGMGAAGNFVLGNYIGTDVTGTAPLGNVVDGVGIDGAPGNTIGGPAPGDGNLISANGENGVFIAGAGAVGNTVTRNKIGTDVTGTAPLGNGQHGVHFLAGASDNDIGGAAPLDANTIAFNGGTGVFVESGTGNRIHVNSIHSNAQLGIDLNAAPGPPDGVTLNDNLDPDMGGNNLQNFPEFSVVTNAPLRVQGNLNSLPVTNFVIQVFDNTAADPSGFGEGETFIDVLAVVTNADGDAAFDFTLPLFSLPSGHCVTMTATNDDLLNFGDTSEFSTCEFGPNGNGDGPILLINEIDYDQPGVDGAEFIELKNAGAVSVNLGAFELQLIDGDGGGATAYQTIDLPNVELAAGDYYVICGNAGNVPNCDLDVLPDSDLIEDGAPDAVALLVTGTLSEPTESGTADGMLSVGETFTYTGTYTAQQSDIDNNGGDDGDIDNTATVTSTEIPTPQSDSAAVPIAQPLSYSIVKRVTDVDGGGAGAAVDAAGDVITYSVVVTNTGSQSINGVLVSDPLLEGANGTLSGQTESGTADGILSVDESFTYTGTYTAQQSDIDNNGIDASGNPDADGDIDNTATVTSTEIPTPQSDSAAVPIAQPGVSYSISKTVTDVGGRGAGAAVVAAGDVITYSIVVTNTGSQSINGVVVRDPRLEGSIVDTVSYGGNTGTPYTEGSGVGLVDDPNLELNGISRFPDGQDTDQNNIDFTARPITPGATNSAATGVAVLDVNGDGNANPFQDGILIVRYMLGQPDANLEDPALIPAGSTRTTGAEIRAFLDAAGDALDANGDGNINPFQDGILIVRFLLGQPDANLEDPALIPPGSTRTTGAEIRAHLETLLPPPAASEGEFVLLAAGSRGEGESIAQTLVSSGDVNRDGSVTARDALNVLNAIQRGESNADQLWSLDTNRDGKVAASDALYVINRLADASLISQLASAVSDSPQVHEASDAVDRLLSDQAFVEGLF